jgi:phenylpropionate dioxygenase-like ring-hydroxylating dioxygenase large terminal subunit
VNEQKRTSHVHLPRFWYVACLAGGLGAKRPVARTVAGVPLTLFRDGAGRAAAVLDRCPHRNVPLSLGRVRDGELECRYHGWRFDGGGACLAIPGLSAIDTAKRARSVDAYPTLERDGFVWVYPDLDSAPPPEPYRFPHAGDPAYDTVRRTFSLTGTMHAAVENALDVPHTAFLHGGLFRGGREPVEIDVVVRQGGEFVEAEYIGEPRPPGIAGKILAPGGGVVVHHDRFILPSIAQVEYRLEDNHLLVTSAWTPVDETTTLVHAAVTFRLKVPHVLVRAVLPPIAKAIFAQDGKILAAQAGNIARFGGEQFVSTELDVLGQHILRMLRRAERGEPAGDPGPEQRLKMRV